MGKAAIKYTKEQLLKSRRFAKRRDLLRVVLSERVTYSIEETEALIEKNLKGKVK